MNFATPSQKLLEGFALILRLFGRKSRVFWRLKHCFPLKGRCKTRIHAFCSAPV